MKMKELMDKCRKKFGGNDVNQMCEDLGLKEMMKEDTVFQRLYDDAIERVGRLEKLRERIKVERRGGVGLTPLPKGGLAEDSTDGFGYPPLGRPSPAPTNVEDTPILDAIENS